MRAFSFRPALELRGREFKTGEDVADVLMIGDDAVDLARALVELRRRGHETFFCEGGPTLNGGLAEAGAIDELCLTMSPALIGGSSRRIIDGSELGLRRLELVHALEDEGFLFLRFHSSSSR